MVLRIKIDKPAVVLEREPSDKDLLEAISLKCANCYGALAMCNSLGGSQTDAWLLCHSYPLKQLVEEAQARNLDLTTLKAAVCHELVTETMYYKRAMGTVTEEEFQQLFREWKNSSRP